MSSGTEFRKVLLKVADGLSTDKKDRLFFILDDDIPKSMQETSVLTAFQHLIYVGLISEGDTNYLQRALRDIGSNNLAYDLVRFDNSNLLLLFDKYDL